MKKTEIRFPSSLKGSRHLAKVDPKFAALIKEVGSVTVKLDPSESVYESLGVSIIYQQLHGKAAASIAERFKKLYSKSNSFPNPKTLLSADLRSSTGKRNSPPQKNSRLSASSGNPIVRLRRGTCGEQPTFPGFNRSP